ncbi:glycosyltransferase family 2 protein [Citreimonas sp.]|uniref:glycosyltransferase family 2 protein n=1 Tax=Citreimonas sp. TaxID=3036715 RepID=UPI004059BF61
MTVSVVILTRDEAMHIERAIRSVQSFATEVLVVDSGSTDSTVELAQNAGARVLHNPWTNHATQMNWAIPRVADDAEWIMRLDADEIVQPDLAREIRDKLPGIGAETDGILVGRRMSFMGKPIRWGGVFPIRILRLIRKGRGRCENRWMDEHLVVEGPTVTFDNEILDDNLKPLTWWTEKHNAYSSLEVVDLLNLEARFLDTDTIADARGGQAGMKRWLKERVYARLPGGSRAFAYFLYRYVVRLGFLDGVEGTAFHVLQGFWYRYLVDMKLRETRTYIARTGCHPSEAVRDVLGIDLGGPTLADDGA